MSRRLRAFKRWMKSQGFVYSDALEFVDSIDSGISVRALCDLKEGDLVATIPKSSCLTIRTSGISSVIEDAGLGGFLGLAMALMYERSLGAASPWEGYLQLLPERECVPLVWSLEEVDTLLVGTELHKIIIEDKKFLYEDWKEYIEPLIQSRPLEIDPNSFGIEQYFSAKSLIASRSFQIDGYHGSDDDIDTDIFYAFDDEKPSVKNFTNTSVGDPIGTLEMVVVKEVEAGGEVFNTYGSMGNAALLHRYGFTELENPYNIVNIDLYLVLSWFSSSYSNRYVRTRLGLWRKLNYSGCSSQNSEYFEVSSDGEPQMELLILLYIFLSENIYQKLDSVVDSLIEANEDDKMIKLLELIKTDCEHKLEDFREVLLTDNVCQALISLADVRESLYGLTSLQEDISRLLNCCELMESKLYHSLVLRVGERKILAKLRAYARNHFRAVKRRRVRKSARRC
ncbi:N-lysine methyltransferase setd6 isoform X2 [Dendrobium catenatum]|uniref:N-lysine methyltransferase setd6 isoform X2 n=1 Tax=Dendrobium catenatum TaxID=906689 RepID=UPI0009F3F789|nr:N-lysine methyltransferase setd6 isoform X2 [Dendrobium catenatum]